MIRATVTEAVLIGAPDVPLGAVSGRVTLSARRAPQVSADLTIGAQPPAVWDALDPRSGAPRVRVTVEVDGNQARTFDLGVRRRERARTSMDVRLVAESDEALLLDYKPLTDISYVVDGPVQLRAVIDDVLARVVGASLEAVPANDASVRPLWNATNELLNPHIRTDATNWIPVNCSSGRGEAGYGGQPGYLFLASSTSPAYRVWANARMTVRGGDVVYSRAQLRGDGATVAANARGRIVQQWIDSSGVTISFSYSSWVALSGSWTLREMRATAPAGAAECMFGVQFQADSTGVGAHVDAALMTASPYPVAYFDGATADTSLYSYSWAVDQEGVQQENRSKSSREVLVDGTDPDALVWRAGQSAYAFLGPLFQAFGLRLVCDEHRAWTLRDGSYRAAAPILWGREGVNLVDDTRTIDRGDDTWFDAAVTRYSWMSGGVSRERVDAYAAATPYTRARLFEKATPYPGPGFSAYAVGRARQRGEDVRATLPAEWGTTVEQAAAFQLDGQTLSGVIDEVVFDLDADRMDVTVKTAASPANAIDLITRKINDLTEPINDLEAP